MKEYFKKIGLRFGQGFKETNAWLSVLIGVIVGVLAFANRSNVTKDATVEYWTLIVAIFLAFLGSHLVRALAWGILYAIFGRTGGIVAAWILVGAALLVYYDVNIPVIGRVEVSFSLDKTANILGEGWNTVSNYISNRK